MTTIDNVFEYTLKFISDREPETTKSNCEG